MMRALKRVLWLTTDVLFPTGLLRPLHRNRPGQRIVMYHGIDHRASTELNTRFISRDTLSRHLEYFHRSFRVVSLSDLFKGANDAHRLTIALSFDDGYANNLELALPLLEKYNMPATFFITGELALGSTLLWPDLIDLSSTVLESGIEIDGELWSRRPRNGELVSELHGDTLKQRCKKSGIDYISKVRTVLTPAFEKVEQQGLAEYWKPLDKQGIRKLAASELVTIGAHGLYHTSLGKIDHDSAFFEMQQSKRALEDVTGCQITALAYPDGSYTRELVQAADEIGFSQQFATDFLYSEDCDDPRIRERFGVNPFMSWNNQLWCLLKGRY